MKPKVGDRVRIRAQCNTPHVGEFGVVFEIDTTWDTLYGVHLRGLEAVGGIYYKASELELV